VSSEQYERSVAESDLYGRDLDLEETIATRDALYEIFGREFLDELEVRDPSLFGMAAKFAVKGAAKAGKSHMGRGKTRTIKRIGKAAHRGERLSESFNNFNGQNNDNNYGRDFDDTDFDLRDFEEDLETREPINFGALMKIGKHVAHHADHAENIAQYIPQGNNNNNNNYGRDFDEEVFEREFDDEELFQREFDDEEFFEREDFDDLD